MVTANAFALSLKYRDAAGIVFPSHAPKETAKPPTTPRSIFENIDNLPLSLFNHAMLSLERLGIVPGRIRRMLLMRRAGDLAAHGTYPEDDELEIQKQQALEWLMEVIERYMALFRGVAEKVEIAQKAVNLAISNLSAQEAGLKQQIENHGEFKNTQGKLNKIRAQRKELEEFRDTDLAEAKEQLQSDPAPSEDILHTIDNTIDETIERFPIFKNAYNTVSKWTRGAKESLSSRFTTTAANEAPVENPVEKKADLPEVEEPKENKELKDEEKPVYTFKQPLPSP